MPALWQQIHASNLPGDKCHDTALLLLSCLHSFCGWTQTGRMSCPWGQLGTAVPAVPSQLLLLTLWLCHFKKLKPPCVTSTVSPRGPKHSLTRAARTKVNSSPQSLVLHSVWRATQIKGIFQPGFILYHNSNSSLFRVRPAYKFLLSSPVQLAEKHNIPPRFLVTAGFVFSGLRKNSEACFTFLRKTSSFYVKK